MAEIHPDLLSVMYGIIGILISLVGFVIYLLYRQIVYTFQTTLSLERRINNHYLDKDEIKELLKYQKEIMTMKLSEVKDKLDVFIEEHTEDEDIE